MIFEPGCIVRAVVLYFISGEPDRLCMCIAGRAMLSSDWKNLVPLLMILLKNIWPISPVTGYECTGGHGHAPLKQSLLHEHDTYCPDA